MSALAATLTALLCADAGIASVDSFTVLWGDKQLTIVAADAPLAAVLGEVGRQTGTIFIGLDQVSGVVSAEIRDTSLREALPILLQNHPYVMTASSDVNASVIVWLAGGRGNAVLSPVRPATDPASAAGEPPVGRDDADPSKPSDGEAARPGPTEVEAARLAASGLFAPNAPEGALIAATKAADPGVRVRAMETLALQNTATGRETIAHALGDSNAFVRNEAISLLLSLGASADADRVLNELLVHWDSTVRQSAVLALGDRSDAAAATALKRALEDEDSSVREMAGRLLQRKPQPNQ